jgi:hypothetical protein
LLSNQANLFTYTTDGLNPFNDERVDDFKRFISPRTSADIANASPLVNAVSRFASLNVFGGSTGNGYTDLASQILSAPVDTGSLSGQLFLYNTSGPYPTGLGVFCEPNCTVGSVLLTTADAAGTLAAVGPAVRAGSALKSEIAATRVEAGSAEFAKTRLARDLNPPKDIYEMDGGVQPNANRLQADVEPAPQIEDGGLGASSNPLLADSTPRNTDRLVLNQGKTPTCGHNSCGMVLDTLGKEVDVSALIKAVPPRADGIVAAEVAALMKSKGVPSASFINREVADIARYTEQGVPVVVRIADKTGETSFSHFVVVDGVTIKNRVPVVAIRDPQGRAYFSPVETFEKMFTGDVVVPRSALK